MKIKLTALFVFLILVLNVLAADSKRPKMGLVLSGGGVRGFAHIGTLQLLDSLDIPVDYIAGTSMGSIIGGFYAVGYSGTEIEEMVRSTNWMEFMTDRPKRQKLPFLQKKDDGRFQVELGLKKFTPVVPSGLIQGQKVYQYFAKKLYASDVVRDFDDLPIPFRCVAVDLITGREIVLQSGSLVKAIRASMSIPTVFSPVEWGDSLFVDGGILNNFPADVAKSMGAEVLIGVNVGSRLQEKKNLHSLFEILNQTMVVTDYAKQIENENLCELVIFPELGNVSITDFEEEKIDQIITAGKKAARKNLAALVRIKKQYFSPFLNEDTTAEVPDSPIILDKIVILGTKSFSKEYICGQLNCATGQKIEPAQLKRRAEEMKQSGKFKKFDIRFKIVENYSNELIIELEESSTPKIYAIDISGNKNLPYRFIYRLLGINPGKDFERKLLDQRISEIYALGYFDRIEYEVEPARPGTVRLKINVFEKPMRKMRIGLSYDTQYQFTGLIGLQATNIPLPGLRAEMFVQFAGLFKAEGNLAYPSRSLDLPLVPYVRSGYKDIPVNIYDAQSGKQLIEYADRSVHYSVGTGLQLGNTGMIEVEFKREYVDINPNYLGVDSQLFPTWKNKLSMINSSFILDLLDNPVIPRKGIKIGTCYETTLKSLDSEIIYKKVKARIDLYETVHKFHTTHFMAFYTTYWNDLPIYKYEHMGGPRSFVGMNYDQIIGRQFGIGRFGYRYELKKDIFLKMILNAAFYDAENELDVVNRRMLVGIGAGVKLLSIIGPFELIVSRGSKSILESDKLSNMVYFSFGYKL